jgi:predicted transcriptional regulator
VPTEQLPEAVTIGETLRVGTDLKDQLERLARAENGEANWLARRVLREYSRHMPRRPSMRLAGAACADERGNSGTRAV